MLKYPTVGINRRTFIASSAGLLAAGRLLGQEALPTGAPGVTVYARPRDYSRDLAAWLARQMEARRQERLRAVAAVRTRAQAEQRQTLIREKVWELLGGRFERTPLNPRVAGSIEREGYRIDRLIFESRPRLFVTCNLYVPAGRGPFPAVLSSLGHAADGKTGYYQHLFHTLAHKGYIVLAFDPFGQGERIEYPGAVAGTSELGGPTREHDYAGKRLLLLGVNFAQYRAWDGIRAIDYLLSRDDVDPKRIGCGGQSGGGTMTMYLAALDERIAAAIVSEGNTENVAQAEFEPPGAVDDAEQNLVPSLVYGLDRFDLLHAFAPRPLLITISNKDAGTTYGPQFVADSLAAYEELKALYRLFDAEDRVRLVETPMRHGYVYEMRRASYGWYNRWLGRPNEDDREALVTLEPANKLWCTPTGFTGPLDGEWSLTLMRQLSQQTKASETPDAVTVRQVLGLSDPSNAAQPGASASLVSRTEKFDHRIEELDVPSEEEIHLPAWLVRPHTVRTKLPALVVFADGGKDAFLGDDSMSAQFAREGFAFCAADVRGRGQCTPAPPSRGPRYYAGRGEDFYVWDTLMLGRPMLGGYVRDMQAVLAAVRSRNDVDGARIWLAGQGSMAVAALFAFALDPACRGAIIQGAVTDYRSIVENDRYTTPFRLVLPGVLKHFDLPGAARLAGARPLMLLNPVAHNGRAALEDPAIARRVTEMYPGATIRAAEPVTARAYLQWLREQG